MLFIMLLLCHVEGLITYSNIGFMTFLPFDRIWSFASQLKPGVQSMSRFLDIYRFGASTRRNNLGEFIA